jgi:hypothetical protein
MYCSADQRDRRLQAVDTWKVPKLSSVCAGMAAGSMVTVGLFSRGGLQFGSSQSS